MRPFVEIEKLIYMNNQNDPLMVGKAKTKFSCHKRGEGKIRYQIRVPKSFAEDTQFPFSPNQKLLLILDLENSRIIVEPLDSEA